MNNPLVSVIIPTYKSRGGLKKSIDSVLNQSFGNLEIIVVDDNNPDTLERKKTEEIMCDYVNDPRIIYIKHERNKNGAAARNTGIRESHGEFIAFLDDDDEWMPQKIEKQVDYILKHDECDAIYTYTVSNGMQLRVTPYEGDVLIPLLMNRSRMYTSTILMKRNPLISIGGFDESFRRHQDYELLVKFFDAGYKMGCLREVLVRYTPLGGNAPKGKDFILLKDRFLSTFESVINKLEKKEKGSKNRIIAANYALVFYALFSWRCYNEAKEILFKYFKVSPLTFINQCVFMLYSKLTKKAYKENV